MIENIRKYSTNTVRFTVDLDTETHKKLKQLALNNQCAATEIVRYAINQLLIQQEKHN